MPSGFEEWCSRLLWQCLDAVISVLAVRPDPYRSEEWFRGFEAAHELNPCGHSRGDDRDAFFVRGKILCDCHCVGCEREDALNARIRQLEAAKTEVG